MAEDNITHTPRLQDTPDNPAVSKIERVAAELYAAYQKPGNINHTGGLNLPSYTKVKRISDDIITVLFPGFICDEKHMMHDLSAWTKSKLTQIYNVLYPEVASSIRHQNPQACENDCTQQAQSLSLQFLDKIGSIRNILGTDAEAAYYGDPSATCREEIILCYPGIYAIALYRAAHELYRLGIPLIPRMITEYAHRQTGIDIHPGAVIGSSFFIDHGTGVVIGGTTIIGNHVKLYQHVTLGALSFKKDPEGNLIRSSKRHPTVEDNVVIYAGKHHFGRVIGANVWITESVPPYTNIIFEPQSQKIRSPGIVNAILSKYDCKTPFLDNPYHTDRAVSRFLLAEKDPIWACGNHIMMRYLHFMTPWEKIIAEHSGTRYAGYAYLLLADSYFAEGTTASLKTSEIYYKLFMDTNRNSHLVVILNYLLNESKLMVHHTDASPYKRSHSELSEFYFIYPNSVYLEMVQDILARSVEKLALIEENIGDWYYKQKLYSASVNRFRLILRDYPTYSGAPRVSEKLVKALKNNNQEQTAEEFIKAVEAKYDAAIQDFLNFIRRYPQEDYADNALFWLAMSYWQTGNTAFADRYFREILTKYEHGTPDKGYKTADAIFMLGRIYTSRKDPDKAGFIISAQLSLSREYCRRTGKSRIGG
ncbi:hypothetical protein CHS0354_030055 [Potamilus streckersoni]|uniref:Outer membrane lipoprotein BamD-like domain-containing protein n=1 Tax=Potamilus streckersoni TaxID=2493646 RepID=A0AAE0RKY9_9BIVA|nr:hypothetical protein CHS0354_030055 [Potamilus streckersoni]